MLLHVKQELHNDVNGCKESVLMETRKKVLRKSVWVFKKWKKLCPFTRPRARDRQKIRGCHAPWNLQNSFRKISTESFQNLQYAL